MIKDARDEGARRSAYKPVAMTARQTSTQPAVALGLGGGFLACFQEKGLKMEG